MQKSKISGSSASTRSDYVRYAPSTVLKAGMPAPDFTLHTTPDQKVSLSEFRDRPTILAFSKDRKLRFPLLSDFEPKGEVARKYGVYRREDGVSERALFVIDKDGIIRWSYVSPIGVNPSAHGILNALEDLNSQKKKVGEPFRKDNRKAK